MKYFHFLQIGWLNAIREWQEEFVGNMSSREFVDTITRDLLGSRVFVFTPRGEVRIGLSYTMTIFSPFSWLKKTILEHVFQYYLPFLDDFLSHYMQIKNLPQGATVIDYAYMIHTEIGNKMVAAKVSFVTFAC